MLHARHILIPFKGWWPPDRRRATLTKEEAYGTAVELRRRVLSGESFTDLARVHSACPSAEEGGDLGVFLPGDMEPAFEEALRRVQPGEIAPIARTEHGWHVIQRLA
ncbi:MAG: peptidylprolyl isomerase [Alphaproteobacteria bacterium]|nr:peptidylprolyl isomerase [Alphaproteobacteria bacterium]